LAIKKRRVEREERKEAMKKRNENIDEVGKKERKKDSIEEEELNK
jgi:hypothetical protein